MLSVSYAADSHLGTNLWTVDELEAVNITATNISTDNITVIDTIFTSIINTLGGGNLDFRHDGVTKMSLDDDGNLNVTRNLTVNENLTVIGVINNEFWISAAPFLDENTANVANKPTLVSRGLFLGYSLPEYAADEELLFRMRIPHEWDGTTNPWFVAITSISTNEDIGDKYKFQLEWVSEDIEHIVPDNGIENITCEVTVSNGTAYYAEIIAFEFNASTMISGQNLQARLRRIAASSSSVDNEIIIWHWDTRWKMNRLGTQSIQGYDG